MIRVRSEQFLPETVRKFHARETGLFKILKNVGLIVCIIDLSLDYGISSTFNNSDLIKYKEPALIPSDPFEPVPFFESDPPLSAHKPN